MKKIILVISTLIFLMIISYATPVFASNYYWYKYSVSYTEITNAPVDFPVNNLNNYGPNANYYTSYMFNSSNGTFYPSGSALVMSGPWVLQSYGRLYYFYQGQPTTALTEERWKDNSYHSHVQHNSVSGQGGTYYGQVLGAYDAYVHNSVNYEWNSSAGRWDSYWMIRGALANSAPTPPAITNITNNQILNYTNPTVNWNFYDSDVGDYQTAYQIVASTNGFASYQYNSGVVINGNKSHTMPNLGDGIWSIAVKTRDSQGVWSTDWGYAWNVVLDAIAPSTGVADYGNEVTRYTDAANGTTVRFHTKNATDNLSGVKGVYFWDMREGIEANWVGQGWGTNYYNNQNFYYDMTIRGEGVYLVRAHAMDKAGNGHAGNWSSNVDMKVVVDRTKPTHASDSITGANYVNGSDYWVKPGQTISVKAKAEDALSGIGYMEISTHDFNYGGDEAANAQYNWQTNSGGALTDASENPYKWNHFSYQNITPTNPRGSAGAREIEVSMKANSTSSVLYHDTQIMISDRTNNIMPWKGLNKRINIDGENPTLILTPNTTSWTTDDVVINAVGSDGTGSGVKRIKKPDGTYEIGAVTTYNITTNGTYLFEIEDNVGNVYTESIIITNIDKTPPVLTVDSSEIENAGTFSYLVRNKLNFTGVVSEDKSDSKVDVYYYIENGVTNQKIMEDALLFEQYNHVNNAPFTAVHTIDLSMKNGNYILVVYAKNSAGLIDSVVVPFEVVNPITENIDINVYPQPNGIWEKAFLDVYVSESGNYELLENAQMKYEITNAPKFPSELTKDIPVNKKITLNKVGENYLHIQYTLENGSKTSKTIGPYLIDTSEIENFDMKIVDSSGNEINGWTNKEVYLSISNPENASVSGYKKQYRIENYHTDWQDYKEGMKLTLGGEYRVFGRILTQSGNTSEQLSVKAKIDKKVPIIKDLVIEKIEGVEGVYNVTAFINDGESGVEKMTLDNGKEVTSYSSVFEIKGLTSKPNYITASDHAGNSTDTVSFAAEPMVVFEAPYTLDADMYKEDAKVTITGGANVSYKVGNKVVECKEATCEITISRNTTLTVSNKEGEKETKLVYHIKNINKSEIRLLLNGERDLVDPTKISFKWNYDLTNGTLTCIEGGRVQTYDVTGTLREIQGKNYLYECFVEGLYGGETLKSNRVMIYYDSSSGLDESTGLSEKEVNHNVYIEETGAGTGYFINVRSNNYKYETLPLPENEVTKNKK